MLGVILAVALALGVLVRVRTARHEAFIPAPPQAVWDAYFMHVKRADYRRGRRILDIETLSTSPLTIRATFQLDLNAAPKTMTYAFPLYEPPHRYRIETLRHDGGPDPNPTIETGEMTEMDGGTRLLVSIEKTGRSGTPFLLAWIVRRRVRRNMEDLANYCAGRPIAPQRTPIRRMPGEVWIYAICLPLLALRGPWFVMVPAAVLAIPLLLWRSWDVLRRI